ncbi:class I SAM-dependent methyltransferase [Calidifontibacter sp. DB0510]|uniref:Class I SAM-dependent methyltransferase n=1 Tax=Metallococcus carri TaxID=1656884 RepID=A0A967AXR8_9MICO|nr:class I SAM-dependent methyltransferase [Metallococcus carri]NOP37297.1 class I SAM-dependent methyltransferase [Calidifontibacter sp. DB2511S]
MCGGPVADLRLAPGCTLDRCTACGHLARDLTRAPARHRDLAYGGEPTLDRIRLDLTYRAMRRYAEPRSVFEIGYGSGSMLRRFLDGGATVAGADPDQLQIGVDEKVRREGTLHEGPVESLDPAGVDADLVYGIHVLEHVADPVRTMRVARDLLAPGGMVQFLTPAGDSDGIQLYRDGWWMLEDPTHVRFFTAASLARAAEDAGLIRVRVLRPVLDSLVTDAASVARRLSPRDRPRGVLSSRAVLGAGLASAPVVLGARLARPRLRPTLHLVAERPR